MAIIIQKAGPDDSATLALLGRMTFREAFGALFERREEELRAYLDANFAVAKLAASLTKPENHYWLALASDLPVGYAKLKQPSANALIDDAAAAQLQKIYVLAEFLTQGIGHGLMQAAMAEATKVKVKQMWLTVLDSNDRAIRFYERTGWTRAGTTFFSIGAQDFSFLLFETNPSI